MDSFTTPPPSHEGHHKAIWSTNFKKYEVWFILGRSTSSGYECYIHEQSREEVRGLVNTSIFWFIYLVISIWYYTIHIFSLFSSVYLIYRALINVMKSHSHLMAVDSLLVRSCLYLMPFDNLMECIGSMDTELLDILHAFTNKAPQDISYSNFEVKWKLINIISEIQYILLN